MVTSEPTSVRLRYRQADVYLAYGQYLMGRSASCQIVLDHPRVSRRHARLAIEPGRVSVEDLGSVNGVYVNGERIVGTRELRHGDRILIGSEELSLHIDAPQDTSARISTLRGANRPSVAPAPSDTQWEAVTGGAGTQKAEIFELVGKVVDRSLAEGRAQEAESIIAAHLLKVLDQARQEQLIADSTRTAALHYALELSRALGTPRWIDYAVELLTLQRVILGEALGRELENAASRIGADPQKLARYAAALKTLPDSGEKHRAIARIDSLTRTATKPR